MSFPLSRPRRLRRSRAMRSLVAETRLHVDDLIAPLFFDARLNSPESIDSMPGQARWPVREAASACGPLVEAGVKSVLLFGLPSYKDELGSSGWQQDGVIQEAVAEIRRQFADIQIITDVCLCEYTSHGHCGV